MANTKEYKIVINGITESISAVDSLNKKLENLEQRINTINTNKVTSSAGGSSSSSNASSLSEEEKLAKQIEQIDQKREAYSKEIYQNYLKANNVLSETVKDQKQIAASERLQANNYSNTIRGMKQELADIKQVMQTVDLDDTAEFDRLTQRANELNAALKKIEETYGQFGRNVGNYKSAFDGLDKIAVEVGGVVREFGSAREASKTLKNELTALQNQGKGNTQQAEELRAAYYRLKSTMDDATKSSQAMDNAMDFMQSFTAMASVGNGLQSFFGFDDNEITKSIQKLVALQGVLNGLETLRKQMETQEGIGAILGKGFKNIDKWTYSLQRTNVALRGTGTSAHIAAAGIKVLNYALKGLMTLGIAVALDLIVEGVQKLVKAVKDFAKGDADLVDVTEVMKNAIDAQNIALEKNLDLIKKRHDAGDISSEQARIQIEREYAKSLQDSTKNLMLMADALQKMGSLSKEINLKSAIGDKGVTWIGGFDKAIESIDDFIDRWDYLENAVTHDGALESWMSSASDAKDEFAHLNQVVGEDFMSAMKKFNDGTAEGTRKLIAYIEQMDKLTSGRYTKAMNIVKFDNEGLQKDIENAWAMIQNLRDNVFKNPIVVKLELDAKINTELDRLDPTRAAQRSVDEWKAILKKGVDEAGNVLTDAQKKKIKKIINEQEKSIAKQKKQRLDSEKNAAKKVADETERVERELNQLRLELMKEGLEKTLSALTEERRVKLYEAKKTGIKVAQQEALIKEVYRKKELEAIKEHNKEVAKLNSEMWEQIYRSQDQTMRMNLDSQLTNLDTKLQKDIKNASEKLKVINASYGGTKFNSNVSDKLKSQLGYWVYSKEQEASESRIGGNFNSGIERAQQYQELLEQVEAAQMRYKKSAQANSELQEKYTKETLDNAEKELNAWVNKYKSEGQTVEEFKDFMEDNWATEVVRENNYTKSIYAQYTRRIDEIEKYYNEVELIQKKNSKDVLENDLELLEKERLIQEREENSRYADQISRMKENLEKGLMTQESYDKLSKAATQENENAITAIQERAKAERERLIEEDLQRQQKITAEGFRGMLNEYRDAYDAISKIQSRQPQTDKAGWGVVNIKATRKNYKEALEAYKALSNDILTEKNKLQQKFDDKQISFNDFQQARRELDGLAQDTADAAQEVTENLKKVASDFLQSIQGYIQAAVDSFNQIMSAVWDAQDNQNEKEKEALDKTNKILEDKLKKQQEIVEQHKSKIDSIEDELSTARGDRRQHLIDQLNAEMRAQREAQAQEKKIQKEKEANERKQEELETKRKKQQYHRDMLQAVVNGAMAVTYALVNKWPVPAIPMAALAASTAAAQIGIMAANKPYAKGGLLEGKSHAEGGIPVGNTGIEVEGKEYIIRKKSTAPNIEILDYINKSERKLDLDDFIEFYSSGKVKKNISQISPKSRFADGGTIPTLSTDYSFDDRLLNAFEDYSNRPVYVSVQDINSRQKAVKNVQVLAGIQE